MTVEVAAGASQALHITDEYSCTVGSYRSDAAWSGGPGVMALSASLVMSEGERLEAKVSQCHSTTHPYTNASSRLIVIPAGTLAHDRTNLSPRLLMLGPAGRCRATVHDLCSRPWPSPSSASCPRPPACRTCVSSTHSIHLHGQT